MEKWKEVFVGKIPKENYQMQIIRGEKQGLIIELLNSRVCAAIQFGVVQAVRILDEGIVQSNIYSENEISKYKDNNFENIIYEVQEGEFGKQIVQTMGDYGKTLSLKHYVVISENYNVDVITEWEPTIKITYL